MRNPFFPIQGVRATSVGSSAFPLLAPSGTISAPSYSFSGDTDTGFYLVSAGVLSLTVGSQGPISWTTTVQRFSSAASISWTDGSSGGGSADTSLSRGEAGVVSRVDSRTITGAVTDGYTAGFRLTPTYTAATAQTVTRHNYIDLNGATLSGAGPAALTDACVFRFNAAAGTHKATVAATTKTTPGGWDASIKINMNGTIMYIPCYLSTTA